MRACSSFCSMWVYAGLCKSKIFTFYFRKLVFCYSMFCVFCLFLFWIRCHLYRPHNICLFIVYMGANYFVILFSLYGPIHYVCMQLGLKVEEGHPKCIKLRARADIVTPHAYYLMPPILSFFMFLWTYLSYGVLDYCRIWIHSNRVW